MLVPRHPRAPLFPYTTLFRSRDVGPVVNLHCNRRRAVRREDALQQIVSTKRTVNEARQFFAAILDGCGHVRGPVNGQIEDRKSTRLNSSHSSISYAVFCLKKK